MLKNSYVGILKVVVIVLSIFALVSSRSEKNDKNGLSSKHQSPTFSLQALKNKHNIVSVAVIGSGPAGMMAGVYGARAFRDTLVFEGYKPGGLLMDTTDVENWPGEIDINGPDIMKKLRNQAQKLGAYFIQESIDAVDFTQWPYKLITDSGSEFYALTVIIATGATPKRLGIPGENENWASGVSACAVCDAPCFKGLNVMVVGGGDSAAEEAMQLAPYAKQVTVMVRKESMRAAASMQDRLKNYANIAVRYNVELTEILSNEKGLVTSVVVYNNKTKNLVTEPIDGVFLAVGHTPNTEIFKGQLAMNATDHIMVSDRTQKTSVKGIFAAGDVEDVQYRQAGVAAASGIKAALDADSFLSEIGVTKQKVSELKEQFYVYNAPIIKKELISLNTLEDLHICTTGSQDCMTLLMFSTNDCSSCMQMMPVFQEFADEHNEMIFCMVDTDNASDIADHFFVGRVPCVIALKDSKLIGRYNGMMTKQEMKDFVTSLEDEEI